MLKETSLNHEVAPMLIASSSDESEEHNGPRVGSYKPPQWSFFQKRQTIYKRVASLVCPFVLWESERQIWPPLFPKNTSSFSGLKCSSQTAAAASVSPWAARPCLDLVYLVFHHSPETRRRRRRKQEEEEEEGGYLTPFATSTSTLQRTSTPC